jgi:hypothetical protein
MESNRPEGKAITGLPGRPRMVSHRGDVGLKLGNELDYLVKTSFQGTKAGPQGGAVDYRASTRYLPGAPLKHRVKAFRFPPESNRKGFQRPLASPALHRMPLDFPHNGQGHMRALRKLTLTPAKLTDAFADHPSDRSPIFRYVRHARTSAFHFQRRE